MTVRLGIAGTISMTAVAMLLDAHGPELAGIVCLIIGLWTGIGLAWLGIRYAGR